VNKRKKDRIAEKMEKRKDRTVTHLIFTAGKNARKIIQEMMDEAVKKGAAKDEGKTVIFTTSFGDWRRFGARTKRPWKSVVLPVCIFFPFIFLRFC
jgi:hypothetical protein